MEKVKQLIKSKFLDFGFELDELAVERFQKYIEVLLDWNEKINLTAITDVNEIVVKHFIDSASLLKVVNVEKNAFVIDIGTGAGFPGIPLKIIRPDINLTLLDSLNKRLIFLENLLKDLNLEAELIHSRAEEFSRKKDFREKFDIVTSRAVAKMSVLTEYCLAYAKVGGTFAPLKGPIVSEELSKAGKAIEVMGGELKSIENFVLDDGSQRSIVVIKKVSNTPILYPRSSSSIKKKPM